MPTPVTDDRGASAIQDDPVVDQAADEKAFEDAFAEAAGVQLDDSTNSNNQDDKKENDTANADDDAAKTGDDKKVDDSATAKQTGEDQKPKDYEQMYKTLQGIHRKDKETWEQEKALLVLQVEEAKKPKREQKKEPAEAEKAAAEAFIDNLTDEQKAELDAYEADFDVVSKMEGLKRTRELKKLRHEFESWKSEIMKEVAAAKAEIAPIKKVADDVEATRHFETIRNGYRLEDGTFVSGHPDFEKYRDDGSLKAWIDSKPAYLRKALEKVYTSGSATDVVDLYNDFKREQGIQTDSSADTHTDDATDGVGDKVVNLNVRKEEKKKALAAVNTKKTAVNTSMKSKDDFDSAWDEAVSKSGG